MVEPGGQETGGIEEQLRLLQERTPHIDQLHDLIAHLGDQKGMIGRSLPVFDAARRLQDIYEGPVTSDPALIFGLDKLAQSARAVRLLSLGKQPAPGTIPTALTSSELESLVRNLQKPIQGSDKKIYTPEALQDQVRQIIARTQHVNTLPRACGLRAITKGVLQQPLQRS